MITSSNWFARNISFDAINTNHRQLSRLAKEKANKSKTFEGERLQTKVDAQVLERLPGVRRRPDYRHSAPWLTLLHRSMATPSSDPSFFGSIHKPSSSSRVILLGVRRSIASANVWLVFKATARKPLAPHIHSMLFEISSPKRSY